MVLNNRKKGAVEMSLNLIIMLIIGLTVMGLIIGFVTNFLSDAKDSFSQQLTEAELAEKEKVSQMSGILAVGPQIQIVKAGEVAKVHVKMENRDGSSTLAVDFGASGKLNVVKKDVLGGCAGETDFAIIYPESFSIGINSKDTITTSIVIPKTCNPGDEFILSYVYAPNSDVSSTKTVNVRIG